MTFSTTPIILREETLENLEKELEVLAKSKFNNINFAFSQIQNLLDEDIDLNPIAAKCKELNLVSNTGHAPIHGPFFFNEYYDREDREILETRILKSIKLSKLFGIEWLVIHVGTYLNENEKYDMKKSIEHNIKYLDKFVRYADEIGIKIAIENGTQDEIPETPPYADELIEIVEYFNEKYEKEILGICYDFGHANIGKVNIYEEIKKIGNRLKVTHIHDNFGKDDAHNNPYNGTINWNMAMKALKEIKYNGELNSEVKYNPKAEEFINKYTITVDVLNTTYSLLERLENLMNNPDKSNVNIICPRQKDIEYKERECVYVILEKEDGKIVVKKYNAIVLIGGGIDQGEEKEEALKRECFEEAGCTLKNIKLFDIVKSYEFHKRYGNLEILAYIYTAEFDMQVKENEEGNEIITCDPEEAIDKLNHEYQKYVLRKYINAK